MWHLNEVYKYTTGLSTCWRVFGSFTINEGYKIFAFERADKRQIILR